MDIQEALNQEKFERQIKILLSRMERLEREIESIKNQIKDKTIEKNIYNTSSTISQNTIDIDMDRDYGQQSF